MTQIFANLLKSDHESAIHPQGEGCYASKHFYFCVYLRKLRLNCSFLG